MIGLSPCTLRATGIEAGYGQMRVLHGVSIRVPKGAIVAVLGVNGAGKSTLLNVIAGVHKHSAGTIESPLGQDVSDCSATERVRRNGIVLVPGEGGIFNRMTVQENLELGARIGVTRRKNVTQVELLESVIESFPQLSRLGTQLAGNLSGGERAMVRAARALATLPSLLLLDEPSNGLAPLVVTGMFDRLEKYVRQSEMSMLLVEQDAELALKLATYAYVLDRGCVIAEGDAASLRNSQQINASYLGIAPDVVPE